jgi:hypothetical protein
MNNRPDRHTQTNRQNTAKHPQQPLGTLLRPPKLLNLGLHGRREIGLA